MDEANHDVDLDAYRDGDMSLVSVLAFKEGGAVCRTLVPEQDELLHQGFLLAECTRGDLDNKGPVQIKVLLEFKITSSNRSFRIRMDEILQRTLDDGKDGVHWSADLEVGLKYILTRWSLAKKMGEHHLEERVALRKTFLEKSAKHAKDVDKRLRAQQSKCYVYN